MKFKMWVLALFSLQACSYAPLETAKNVELTRYAGKWFEIASFPQVFQKGCVCTFAQYTLQKNGDITVYNQCRKDSIDGPIKDIEGKAWAPDPNDPAKLKVQFFWPFSAKYWILDLDPDYQWAVVGHPNRKYLWILSRTPNMPGELYQTLCNKAKSKGFDIQMLQKTPQLCPSTL